MFLGKSCKKIKKTIIFDLYFKAELIKKCCLKTKINKKKALKYTLNN